MNRLFLLAGASVLLLPRAASAHVKWFCGYDTTVPPLPLREGLTPAFLAVATGFAALMFLAYLIDRVVDESDRLGRLERALLRLEPSILLLVRATVGAFFVSLWTMGGVILTPELKTTSGCIPWLQLAIAASTLFRPTLVVTALGIVGLYCFGVARYGAFHMMDYPIFLGIAAYLGCSVFDVPWLQRVRLPLLYCNVAVTMMWGAIEKFGYPYWTFPLLATHRGLTLGMPYDVFMTVAGFVEFSLAFFMLTGTALLRLACLALLLLLTSAVPEFGKIDAIGHSLIIVGLVAMIIVGERGIRLPQVLRDGAALTRSALMTAGYGLTMAAFFGLYYGSQYVAGRQDARTPGRGVADGLASWRASLLGHQRPSCQQEMADRLTASRWRHGSLVSKLAASLLIRARHPARKDATGALIAAASSWRPSDPATHRTSTPSALPSAMPPVGIAAISALDLGGVAVPQSTKVGAGGGVSNVRNACRSATGSSAPVTKATEAKRPRGRRARPCFPATKAGVTSPASA